MRPETRYARVDDAYVAYQVIGDGPIDLVYTSGWFGHVEAQWDYPALARFLERLASFSRLICFDRRGHGLSDPVDLDNITLEQWMEDVRVVMDAAGSERAALLGAGEGGPMTMLYAATHPQRTSALLLVNTSATMVRRPGYPWGMPDDARQRLYDGVRESYWDSASAKRYWGSIATDDRDQEQLQRLFRYAVSPGMARRLLAVTLEADMRDVLPTIRVPTLVVHRSENPMRRVGHGRYLGENIPGAKYAELPGVEEHPWSGDQDAVVDEVEEFLTGVRPPRELDRVLATVLFTDIVASTEHAVKLGDRGWREVLERHDAAVVRELERHRGRKVTTIGRGDGVLATFDGPARGVKCAQAIVQAVQELGFEGRAGLHTGEIELRGEDVAGIAVHIADRVTGQAQANEVLVSRTVVDLVAGSGLSFAERGAHNLKGVPGEFKLYAVDR